MRLSQTRAIEWITRLNPTDQTDAIANVSKVITMTLLRLWAALYFFERNQRAYVFSNVSLASAARVQCARLVFVPRKSVAPSPCAGTMKTRRITKAGGVISRRRSINERQRRSQSMAWSRLIVYKVAVLFVFCIFSWETKCHDVWCIVERFYRSKKTPMIIY